MKPLSVKNNKGAVVSSLEIASTTGKLHKNIIRDIEAMLGRQCLDPSRYISTYKDAYNRNQKMYLLPIKYAVLLLSGYSEAIVLSLWDLFTTKEKLTAEYMDIRVLGITQRNGLTDVIKNSGEAERMHLLGYNAYAIYTTLINKTAGLGYKKRIDMDAAELHQIKILESVVEFLISSGKTFEQIVVILNSLDIN